MFLELFVTYYNLLANQARSNRGSYVFTKDISLAMIITSKRINIGLVSLGRTIRSETTAQRMLPVFTCQFCQRRGNTGEPYVSVLFVVLQNV